MMHLMLRDSSICRPSTTFQLLLVFLGRSWQSSRDRSLRSEGRGGLVAREAVAWVEGSL